MPAFRQISVIFTFSKDSCANNSSADSKMRFLVSIDCCWRDVSASRENPHSGSNPCILLPVFYMAQYMIASRWTKEGARGKFLHN